MTVSHFFAPDGGGWNQVLRDLRARRPLLLLLDYDGTIVPIKSRPALAVLPPAQRNLLAALAESPGFQVGIVTGRSLADIRRMVQLNKLIFIANHGLEIQTGGFCWIHPRAKRTACLLSAVNPNLKEILAPAEGVEIEDKTLTLSIHYRNMKGWTVSRLRESINEFLRPYQRELKICAGKKVFEIRPNVSWDKGRGVQKIIGMIRYRKPLKIFLGDDLTDEDVFRVLKKDGIGIKVGRPQKTEAHYYLRSPQEVLEFLKIIKKSLVN